MVRMDAAWLSSSPGPMYLIFSPSTLRKPSAVWSGKGKGRGLSDGEAGRGVRCRHPSPASYRHTNTHARTSTSLHHKLCPAHKPVHAPSAFTHKPFTHSPCGMCPLFAPWLTWLLAAAARVSKADGSEKRLCEYIACSLTLLAANHLRPAVYDLVLREASETLVMLLCSIPGFRWCGCNRILGLYCWVQASLRSL